MTPKFLRRILPVLILVVCHFGIGVQQARADADDNMWTWMGGDSSVIPAAKYGTLGVPTYDAFPGRRGDAASWTDDSGAVWIFGGYGVDSEGAIGALNDLWKHDPITGQVTWVKGSSKRNAPNVFGTQGVPAPENTPGGRSGATFWKGSDGKFWLYGGAYTPDVVPYEDANFGYDDLWRFDPVTQNWTWMKGDPTPGKAGVYGTLGVPASDNTPGMRHHAVGWADTSGALWLFGGSLNSSERLMDAMNDLWRYDLGSNDWTWMKGSAIPLQPGTPGEIGIPASSNCPEAAVGAASWVDNRGDLWLFSGHKARFEGDNSIWRFTTADGNWTRMNESVVGAVYGIQGEASPESTPPVLADCTTWVDASGALWLYGGYEADGYENLEFRGHLNQFWKFDPATGYWTWWSGSSDWLPLPSYGVLGVPSPDNSPGGRACAVGWVGDDGALWLFGGFGRYPNLPFSLGGDGENDLWRFDPDTGEWTWVRASQPLAQPAVYGTLGTSNADTNPGARGKCLSVTDKQGALWLLGGERDGDLDNNDIFYYADLWQFQPATNQWTWMAGPDFPILSLDLESGDVDQPADSPPFLPNGTFWAEGNNHLWLFGGWSPLGNSGRAYRNDLWMFDKLTRTWSHVSGSSVPGRHGVYGTLGVPAPMNVPGGRHESISWDGPAGTRYIFGGYGYPESGSEGFLADVWQWDPATRLWTWVNGPKTYASAPVGPPGLDAPENTPGRRESPITWETRDGELYLFGGYNLSGTRTNDLWRFSSATSNWTLIKGLPGMAVPGKYGTLGVPAADNFPSGRVLSTTWVDESGALWLFGGGNESLNNPFSDLWRFDPITNNWTWMAGPNMPDQPAVYGTKGVPGPENTPPGCGGVYGWTDDDGLLWLRADRVWAFDPSTRYWTWMGGEESVNYGQKGFPSPDNSPPASVEDVAWVDAQGNYWEFGGVVLGVSGDPRHPNDLWRFKPGPVTPRSGAAASWDLYQ